MKTTDPYWLMMLAGDARMRMHVDQTIKQAASQECIEDCSKSVREGGGGLESRAGAAEPAPRRGRLTMQVSTGAKRMAEIAAWH